jgi:hypothetical protein
MDTPLQYGKHLLCSLESAGQLACAEDQVSLGESLQPWFLGEKTVTPPWNSPQAFFWQRLCRAVSEAESTFFRFSLPPGRWPVELADWSPPVWVFWTVVHYEAPRLVEEAVSFAVDERQVGRVPLDMLMNELDHLNADKLHVPEEVFEDVLARLRETGPTLLAERTDEVRAEMSATLATELERIRVYYDSLLRNRAATEETRFLLQEREQLIREHHRRLSPEGLRIHVRVQFGAVLTRKDA